MWGSFMKEATRGAKPEWLPKPTSIVGVDVCRVSGKLPNEGCGSVEVLTREGAVESRSMIYTEYFVKGTQPTSPCPLHEGGSFLDAIAGVFGRRPGSAPVPVDATGLPDTDAVRLPGERVARPSAPVPGRGETPDRPNRRGFWSRIFGDDDAERQEEEEQKKKEAAKKKPRVQ